MLKPHKNSKGDRRFTKENIEQLQLIFDLVKNRGFTIEGAKNEIRQNKDLIKQRQALLQKLIHLKADMMKLKESLNQDGEFQHNTQSLRLRWRRSISICLFAVLRDG